MGNRYWMTGVQLGMLKAAMLSKDRKGADKIIDGILEEQMLFIDNDLLKKITTKTEDAKVDKGVGGEE